MLTAPATGETLTIYRDPSITQGLDLVENDAAPAEDIEEALDRGAMISQRISELTERSMRLSDGFVGTFDLEMPSDLSTPGATIIVNTAGDGFEMGPTDVSLATLPFRDVVYLTSASSPYTVTADQAGKVFHCDCTGGAIAITLPTISAVTGVPGAFVFVKSDISVNKVTISRASTDTIEGATSLLLSRQNAGAILCADTDASPDDWTSLLIGASGGGGSGVVLDWYEGANSPVLNTLNNMQVYSFNNAEAQELYSEMTVPTDYVVGTQLVFKGKFYSDDTSGTMLMRTQATLIRKETDVVSSTTNQHTSTNSAVTASGANQNEIQQISCDLSSSTGTINSVSVSAGDTILVRLYRDTDTSTGVIGFLKKQGEVRTS
jgi:hypothetical protein